MKTNLINAIATAGTIHLSRNLVNVLLQELVTVAQAVTTNVHHPDYMKKDEIVECYEKITGEKFSKSFIKAHKREDFIDLAGETICEELSAYTDEMVEETVEPELNKPEEVNEMNNVMVVKVDKMNNNMINLLKVARIDGLVLDQQLSERIFKITGEVIEEGASRTQLIDVIKSYMTIDYDKMMAKNPNVVFELETQEEGIQRVKEEMTKELNKAGINVVFAEDDLIIGKEIGFDTTGVIDEDKVAAGYPAPVSDLKVSEVKADVNLPLYIKEDNCDIESKSLDKRLLMAQVINAASSNIVKAFISKGMMFSIINKELFGVASLYKNPAMKVDNQGEFSPAEVALATKTLDELVSDYLIPHKMGYIVKPYYMAWFHKNANLTYKVKGREYLINTTRKVIINLVTKRAVPLNKTNCEWLNDGLFVRLAK